MLDAIAALIKRWKSDPDGTYRTWFLWEERIKNFRTIRSGLALVVSQIESIHRVGAHYMMIDGVWSTCENER